jgi:hypothetical protein
MAAFGQQRVRETLAWEYSEPPLLAAYDRMFGASVITGSGERTA